MEILYRRCAGLDVHKETVAVCVLTPGPNAEPKQPIQQFGATTGELRRLGDWLRENGVTQAAMESTGVYSALSSALIGRVQVAPALG